MLGGEEKIPQSRLLVVQYGILVIFLGLAFGLWRLQVMGSDRYGLLAERNRIRTVPLLAPRGKILDREGRILVDNYPSFSALLLREQPTSEEDLGKIAAGLNLTPEMIRERLRKMTGEARFQPVRLKDDITPDELAFIDAHRNELPQLDTIVVHRRLYPRDGFAAHLIGYVGEVSEEMLNRPQYELYSPGDVVGRSGVEQTYNALLMGTAAGLLKDVLTHTLFGVNGFAKCLLAFLISGLGSKFMLNQPVPQFGSLVVGTLAEFGIAWALLATLGREFADPLPLERALVNGAVGMLLFGVFNRLARRGSRAAHAS